ncbi:hypothetical protein Q3G72_002550 [Acer saccharum]|nr:hypothetical protein Q3G72_002550 [Acer saccharum]
MEHMIHHCPIMVLLFMLITFILVNVLVSVSAIDDKYEICSAPFRCKDMDISYPFWGGDRIEYCGYPGFKVDCNGGVPQITIADRNYRVLKFDRESKIVSVAIQDYWDSNCPTKHGNSTLNFTIFDYSSDTQNISLYYDCPSNGNKLLQYRFNCSSETSTINYFFTRSGIVKADSLYLKACGSNVEVVVWQSTIESIDRDPLSGLNQFLRDGFGLQWYANNSLCDTCQQSNGVCGYDSDTREFTCYCPDQPYKYTCTSSKGT